jgi:nitrite reductase/ring-hydroxylating ferredoxin subunit/Fe-S cluster biogenesis protein NfuA
MEPEPLPEFLADELDRLAGMIASFEADPDEALQGRVFELLTSIDRVHRAGLRRLDELLRVAGLQARAVDDPEVRLLYDLYDLGEGGELQRAEAVLGTVAPYIESHGGRVTVVEAEAGVVRVSLSGACSTCQGSTATLRHVIEGALRDGLADFERMEVVEAPTSEAGHAPGHAHGQTSPAASAPAGFIPIESLRRPSRPVLTWRRAFDTADLVPGSVRVVEVAGEAVIVANVAGEYYAYRDGCPGSPLTLGSGGVEDDVLVCPWHGCRFDLRGGRRIGADGPGLGVVPIAVDAGEVRIGSLAGAAA